MSETRVALIHARLTQAFAPQRLEVRDESRLHARHAGARDGRGHYHVMIVAEVFAGMPLLERHRRVYAALGDLMQSDIHALGIEALAPDEVVTHP